MKKPIFKRWWFWLLIVLVALGAYGGTSSADKEPAPVSDVLETVVLDSAAAGRYGKQITLNAGTDSSYTFFVYALPAGDYRVTNKNASGGAQVSVYTDGTHMVNSQEEMLPSDTRPIVLMGGETKELHLADGEVVKLADGDKNIQFERVG